LKKKQKTITQKNKQTLYKEEQASSFVPIHSSFKLCFSSISSVSQAKAKIGGSKAMFFFVFFSFLKFEQHFSTFSHKNKIELRGKVNQEK